MDEVEIHIEEVGTSRFPVDDVGVPDLVEECPRPAIPSIFRDGRAGAGIRAGAHLVASAGTDSPGAGALRTGLSHS